MKNDYYQHLKDGDYLAGLLDLVVVILGHSKRKPIDAKFNFRTYKMDSYSSSLAEVRTLLCYLYFSSLKYLGTLAKTWWLDLTSRQTKGCVEAWTEKYISPLVIADALAEAEAWRDTQDTSDEKIKPLSVVSIGNDLMASYPIDDTFCGIKISLPPTFPLHQVTVSSVSRVAVDDKRWQSYLLKAQGAIAFNNNDLISGLTNFKTNIVGSLKGQTDCAICYSIVAEDGKLPNKKCRTCRNSFHGLCLYRWFKSSNGSSCPLCRNPFNYA